MPSNYSFIDEHLAGSAKPYELDDVNQYIDDGISNIISLTPKLPLVSKYMDDVSIEFHHFPIYATPDGSQIDDFIALMNLLIEQDEKAVVHCQYGQERTGIFLAAYLIEIKGYEYHTAINAIQSKRTGSLQTHNARQFIQDRYK